MIFWVVWDVCILPKFWAALSSSQKQGQEKQVFTKNNSLIGEGTYHAHHAPWRQEPFANF